VLAAKFETIGFWAALGSLRVKIAMACCVPPHLYRDRCWVLGAFHIGADM